MSLGRAVLDLVGDMTPLKRDIGEAKGLVQSSLGGMGGSIQSGIGSAIAGGAAVLGAATAGVAAIMAAKQTVQQFIAAAAESEETTAQLNNVLKSTGGVAGVTANMAQTLASELQKVTRFEDDAIVSGESLLLTFTNISATVFPDATRTMLDMSQALGQDLKASAIQLGKALNDPITGVTALRRVGVSFTEAQQEQIRTLVESNDVLGAQRVILAELAREFGGSATAAGKTYSGQLDIINNQIDDIKEAVGEELILRIMPVMEGGVKPLLDMIQGSLAAGSAVTVGQPGSGEIDQQIAGMEERLKRLQEVQALFESGKQRMPYFNLDANAAEQAFVQSQIAGLQQYGNAWTQVQAKRAAYQAASDEVLRAEITLNGERQRGDEEYVKTLELELADAIQKRDVAAAGVEAAEGIASTAMQAAELDGVMLGAYPGALAYAEAMDEIADASRRAGAASTENAANRAWYAGGSGDFYGNQYKNELAEEQRYAREVRQTRDAARREEETKRKSAIREEAQLYEDRMKQAADRVGGYFDAARQNAKNLFDVTGGANDPLAAGANGPFENMYRLADVAKQGGSSPWAAQLGKTQEEAKRILADFENGIYSAEVKALIDVPALQNMGKMAELAEATKKAFVTELAKGGGSEDVYAALLGGATGGSKGPGKGAAAGGLDKAVGVDVNMGPLADAAIGGLTKEIVLRAGDFKTLGSTAFDSFGAGWIEKAAGSSLLKSTITAITLQVLAEALD